MEAIDVRKRGLIDPKKAKLPLSLRRKCKGVLLNSEEIQKRAGDISKRINEDYKNKDLLLLVILKGAKPFSNLLKIKIPFKKMHARFASYGKQKISSGKIEKHLPVPDEVKGKDVLVIEDIIDSGRTLAAMKEDIKKKGAKSVEFCVLTDKREKRLQKFRNLKVRYSGFIVPDEFIVGCGMDHAERYRRLKHIALLKEEAFKR